MTETKCKKCGCQKPKNADWPETCVCPSCKEKSLTAAEKALGVENLNILARRVVQAALAEGDGQPGFDVDPRPDTAGLGELADNIVDAAERLAGLVDRSGNNDRFSSSRLARPMAQIQRMLSDLVELVDDDTPASSAPWKSSVVGGKHVVTAQPAQNSMQKAVSDFPRARSI